MSADIILNSEWDSIISGKQLVAADFWAPWCPYCMRLKPIFESIANDYPDTKFVKVNVEERQEIASRHGIRGIPVIKFFCDSKEVGEIVGLVPQTILKTKIDEIRKDASSCLSNTSLIK
jgi:thioredoxin 1